MAHTTITPQLSKDWNFVLDGNGNLVLLEGSEAITQNVSNECRCFKNDLYFHASHGINWFDDQLGEPLQKAVATARLREAAEAVYGVESVQSVDFKSIDNRSRTLVGTIQIKTIEGKNGRSEIR